MAKKYIQKSVMHMQSCCFSHKTYCVLDSPIAVAVVMATRHSQVFNLLLKWHYEQQA